MKYRVLVRRLAIDNNVYELDELLLESQLCSRDINKLLAEKLIEAVTDEQVRNEV